ncbi:MAG: helix-turn-helix transcriptional regulator [Cyclobacteriaceae bacterium]
MINPEQNDPYFEKLKQSLRLIKSGEKVRILDKERACYYMINQEFHVKFRGVEFKLDALYCDEFCRSKFIIDFQNYDITFLIQVLEHALEEYNVVMYMYVVDFLAKYDKELLEYIFKNFVTHFVSVPRLLIPQEGMLISKRKPPIVNTTELNRTRIAENVRKIRELKGLRQEDLAKDANVSPRSLGSLECGRENKFYFITLESLANALKVDVYQLL